jgi:transglutaminase-like putative cysteine protease
MKRRKLFLLWCLIGWLFWTDTSAGPFQSRLRKSELKPQRTIDHNNPVEFDLCYDFFVRGDTLRISFIVLLPQTIPFRQNILSIKYSPKPTRIFEGNGNRYAEFVFTRPSRRTKIQITVRAELLKYDLERAREKYYPDIYDELDFREYLKQEKYIEKDNPRIEQIAEDIEGRTDLDIVNNIYNYVIDNLEYTVHGEKDWGAVKSVEEKKGDCSEYSDLFVAICRAKNIPARFITGYTMRLDDKSPKHHWVEVYLRNRGWVPFDPSWGDIRNQIYRDAAFSRMRPVYIYLSHVRNDKVLNNYHFGRYIYWGDRARFKDSIEFKRPVPSYQQTR